MLPLVLYVELFTDVSDVGNVKAFWSPSVLKLHTLWVQHDNEILLGIKIVLEFEFVLLELHYLCILIQFCGPWVLSLLNFAPMLRVSLIKLILSKIVHLLGVDESFLFTRATIYIWAILRLTGQDDLSIFVLNSDDEFYKFCSTLR